jgi:hypothetical protein
MHFECLSREIKQKDYKQCCYENLELLGVLQLEYFLRSSLESLRYGIRAVGS